MLSFEELTLGFLAVHTFYYLVILLPGRQTLSEVENTWFLNLKKPRFTPPNWYFALAWFATYVLLSESLWIQWKEETTTELHNYKLWALILHAAGGVLLYCWSWLFFQYHWLTSASIVLAVSTACITVSIALSSVYTMLSLWISLAALAWLGYCTLLSFSMASMQLETPVAKRQILSQKNTPLSKTQM